MQVWVADELGKVKSCTVDVSNCDVSVAQDDNNSPLALTEIPVPHVKPDFVQLMTNVKYTFENETKVCSSTLRS